MIELKDPELMFGVIADLQYADIDHEGNRYYRNSISKLNHSINRLNQEKLDFLMNLGDTIDRDWKSFDEILPLFDKANARVYHVLGNHDYEVEDQFIPIVHKRLGTSKYYDFSMKNWRFIVLDGNEISTFGNVQGTQNYMLAEEYLKRDKINSNFWNGGIGKIQLHWLEQKLQKASKNHENVMLFCHFPIYPSHRHNLLNDEVILNIIGNYECVKAWICGHNHRGNYGRLGDIHMINLRGMVDFKHEMAFCKIKLFQDRMEVEGSGREISARLFY